MLRVLLVDDEHMVCELIKNLIHWRDLGLEIIGQANDGLTASKIIFDENPDIVITDIRMSGLDGINLVKTIREGQLQTEFIFISGYKYFEYAHNALRYGVVDYLLKPINKLELTSALTRLRDKIMESRHAFVPEQIEQHQELDTKWKRKQLLAEMMYAPERSILDSDITMLNQNYYFHFKPGMFQIVILKLDMKLNEQEQTYDQYAILTQLTKVMRDTPTDLFYDVETMNMANKIVCLFNYSLEAISKVEHYLSDFFLHVKEDLGKFSFLNATIGLGSVEKDIYHLNRSMHIATHAIRCRITLGVNRVISGDLLLQDNDEFNIREMMNYQKEKQFINLVEMFDTDGLHKWFSDFFQEIQLQYVHNPSVLVYMIDEIIELFCKTMQQMDFSSKREMTLKARILADIENSISIKDAQSRLTQSIFGHLQLLFESLQRKDAAPIRIAQKYIHDHYQRDILLKEVASLVNLNPVYFSTLFKKDLGVNFGEYVTNYRLDVAKGLLKDAKYNISEVANLVGYQDAKYFSKQFKKIVGIKPGEYKKLYS